jgi:hypothetical protein
VPIEYLNRDYQFIPNIGSHNQRRFAMIRKMLVVVAIVSAVAIANLSLSNKVFADSPPTADNSATVDITISDTGDMSIGGISLKSLGIMPLSSDALTVVQDLQDVHTVVAGEAVTVDVQGTQVVKIVWSPTSRAAVANLAARYGVQITPDVQSVIENWISTSSVDVTARFTNEPSKPLNIAISKLIQVDIADNGQLSVEKIPLAAAITQATVQMIELGGNQATACLNKGTLTTTVNGAELPTITVNPEGINVLNKALNLNLDPNATSAVLGSKLGVDLSLPGGSHSATATCGG